MDYAWLMIVRLLKESNVIIESETRVNDLIDLIDPPKYHKHTGKIENWLIFQP